MYESDYIEISEYAKRMSLGIRKVYRDYHKGLIEGFQEEETGIIRLKNPFKNSNSNSKFYSRSRVVLYARVSFSQNKTNLDSQLDRIRSYSIVLI